MGALKKMQDALKPAAASVTPIVPRPTLEAARAGREAAEKSLLDATVAVQAVVDVFPGSWGRRDIIEHSRPAVARLDQLRPVDHTRSREGEARLDHFETFDRAVAAEDAARHALAHAKAIEAAAFKTEFGDGRASLAAAIAASAERQAEADAARATAERARGALVKAKMVHSQAEAALAEAREAAIGAATASDGVQPIGLKDLRRAAADALDDVEIASEAVARAEAALADPEYAERHAREKVDEAARAVLAEAAAPMADALDELVVAFKAPMLSRVNFILSALPSLFTSAFSPEQQRRVQVESMCSAVARLGQPVSLSDLGIPRGDELFESALAALKLDAAAPIPEVPRWI